MRALGFLAGLLVVIIGLTLWANSAPQSPQVDLTPAPSATPKALPTRTPDPARERRRVENARAGELHDAKARIIALNKSLGVLFVREVRIDHHTLELTIDGSIWDNETEPDKAAIMARFEGLWSEVYGSYNKGGADLRIRLLDMDGAEVKPG